MENSLSPIVLVLLLVLAAEFVNGWTDAPACGLIAWGVAKLLPLLR
jgi:hypothetical protein